VLAERDLRLLLEAEDLGGEPQGLAWSSTSTLMTLSFMVSPRWSVAGQRSLIWRSGEVSSWWSL
jgi:hypothetical protein